ncbi:hypothetical protein BKA70DRAFT_1229711 [Coprinopsis sp. MPI-PUGE-AT-0042]|nr:hypothetical protein BKA70DRAFT_1229711 [Coprinopsis sp. MPI-PUGE-AT-0042]
MPKVEPVTSIRVTRSRSSTPAAQASMKYQQANNPLSLRRALGRRHSEVEAATSAGSVAQDMLSLRIAKILAFECIPTINAPPHRTPSRKTSEEEGEVHLLIGKTKDYLQAHPTRASDLLVVIGAAKAPIADEDRHLGTKEAGDKGIEERIGELDEEAEERQSNLTQSQKNEVQYRNWWLNEIQFTKLLLNKVPDPNRDIELVRASQAHYVGHY